MIASAKSDRCLNPAGSRRHCRVGAVDAGWLFVLSGAVILAATVLIPPADNLAKLETQRDQLAAQLEFEHRRLEAYSTFLEALDERDPTLVRRLAASHLNLIPETVEPVAMIAETADGLDAHVDNWIHETLPPIDWPAEPVPEPTLLRRISSSPHRLWTILVGFVCIFIGLLPQTKRRETRTLVLVNESTDNDTPAGDVEGDTDALEWMGESSAPSSLIDQWQIDDESSIDDEYDDVDDQVHDEFEEYEYDDEVDAKTEIVIREGGPPVIADDNEALVWVQRSSGNRIRSPG